MAVAPRAKVWRACSAFLALGACGAPLALAACSRAPDDRDAIVVALGSPPTTFDPRMATDAAGQRMSSLLFAALVRLGPRLEVEGEAAESWSYDAKTKTYDFRLRPGLRFADGSAVEASDLEYSFAEFRSAKSPYGGSFAAIDSVRATYSTESGGSLVLRLKEPSAWLLGNLRTIKILPKRIVAAMGAEEFAQSPVGSGPYRLLQADDSRIELAPSLGSPLVAAGAPRLVFKIVRDDETRVLKAIKGEIDVAQNEIPLEKARLLEGRPGLRLYKYPGLSTTYLLLNLRDPALRQLRARRALSLAIDRRAIAERKLLGMAVPAASLLAPGHPWANPRLRPPERDLALAQAEWKAASAPGLAGPLSLKCSNSPAAVENAKVIAAQLKEAGIAVEQIILDWGALYEDAKKGRFQAALMKWVGVVDPDLYRLAFHSSEVPPGRNRGGYANAALDQLLVEGPRLENEGKRREAYDRIQEMVLSDLPIIPLWHEFEIAAVSARVVDYRPPLTGDFSALLGARLAAGHSEAAP